MSEPMWDTTDPDHPQPHVWPECPTCNAPYVWRRALSFTTGEWRWSWFRDCKHKSDPPIVHDERRVDA